MMNVIKFVILILCVPMAQLFGQTDTTTIQEEMFNRPFMSVGATPISIGGYMEGNTNYFSEDGVSEGFSMEFRRFNIFLYSTIAPRVKFLSELEFEHGTEEIELETAQLDIQLDPAFQLRVGVILVPLGAYNQDHDSPKWDFVERPLVATQIIPSTLSEVGFGFNGIIPYQSMLFTYDAYLVNGLTDNIILNEEGRTFLQSGKTEEIFEEDNNGSPAFTGRLAARHRQFGELGISAYTGIYNTDELDGEKVDEGRTLSIFAVDFKTSIRKFSIRGEFAYNSIEVPDDISEIYGTDQWGVHVDVVYPIVQGKILGFDRAVINAALRLERIDYNAGDFSSPGAIGDKIYDEVNAVALAIGFRPAPGTVLKANFRHHWIRDVLGNPTVKSAGFQFGIATYF